MATKNVSYSCKYCSHIQYHDFINCPACGMNTMTGEQPRQKKFTYTKNNTRLEDNNVLS